LSDYVKIHLDGQKILVTRDTLSNIEARLPRKDFIRSHRSFIVSLQKIESFTSECIEIGRNEIPISRSFRDAVLKRLDG
jgi:two-component system LytT family response regulator